jgi:hypothetical protein
LATLLTHHPIPEYFPYVGADPYTIFNSDTHVRADMFEEGVARNDYLTRFWTPADARNSARRYGLFGVNGLAVTIRLKTGPWWGTLNLASSGGGAINEGDELPRGTFLYSNTAALDETGDSFIYEVTIQQPGGAALRLRQEATIYNGYGRRAYVNAPSQEVTNTFNPTLGMGGGGGGDGKLIYDGFKENGANHLVVISSGGTYDDVQKWLEDFPGSRYRFNRIEVFLISTQEHAQLGAIRMAISQERTAVYFTGGDQTRFLDIFTGTNRGGLNLIGTINQEFGENHLSVGGSSAGLAVQGLRAFHGPLLENAGSKVLLDHNNVYEPYSYSHYVKFRDGFLTLLPNVTLTDTHFKERNRMARFVTFLSQTQADIDQYQDQDPELARTLSSDGVARGVAVDEGTALIVTRSGPGNTWAGKVKTAPREPGQLPGYVFFAEAVAGAGAGVTLITGALETPEAVTVTRLGDGERFNLDSWAPLQALSPDAQYRVQISNGRAVAESIDLTRPRPPADLYYNNSSGDQRLREEHKYNEEYIP